MPDTKDYFKDKKVILIGGAANVDVDDISEFDLIVRVNFGFPVPESLVEKTTEKCDVLYLYYGVPRTKKWEEVDLIKLRIRQSRRDKWYTVQTKYKNIWNKLYIFDHFELKDINDDIGCNVNTGLLAMIDILKDNPELLYITGISFYQTPYRYDYAQKSDQKANIYRNKGTIYDHDQDLQIKYFMDNIYHLPNVKVDSTLKKIAEKNETGNTDTDKEELSEGS
jgi:hypothetical protein